MLKPIAGGAVVLVILIALVAGNLRNDVKIESAEETAQAEEAVEPEKPRNVFSRRPPEPPPLEGPGVELTDQFGADDNSDIFASQPNTNDPYAQSPFVDPNSNFAGAQSGRNAGGNTILEAPGAPIPGDLDSTPISNTGTPGL